MRNETKIEHLSSALTIINMIEHLQDELLPHLHAVNGSWHDDTVSKTIKEARTCYEPMHNARLNILGALTAFSWK